MLTMTDTDRGWVAGLFEGEGTVVVCNSNYDYYYPRITLTQLDRSVLDQLRSVTGIGRINGPRSKGSPTYYWSVSRRADVDDFLNVIAPLLSQRRIDQIQRVYKECARVCDCV